jgi:hypothetical protein
MTAGIGWFRRRLWGWRLVVVIIATQVLGDVVSFVRGDLLCVCLEPLLEKFKKDITDERGYRGNFKISSGKNVSDYPSYTPFRPHARALKLSHRKIGIKEEDDKTYLDQRPPDIFFMANTDSLVALIERARQNSSGNVVEL